MSKDKHRSRDRRVALLKRAADMEDQYGKGYGISIHCQGGMALKNRDLQQLMKEGKLRLARCGVPSFFGDHIKQTRALITETGRKALEQNDG